MLKTFLMTLLAASVALLAGCSGPESPQEVSEAFWQAVVEGDAGDASDYSTLVDEAAFDSFGQNWQNVQVAWGRVVIDEQVARVTTTLSGLEGRDEAVETVTYLVRQGDDWLVDYYRTGDALEDGPVWGSLVGQLEKLGEDLKARWAQQSDELAQELQLMGQELQQQAAQMSSEFSGLAEEYGEQLGQQMEAWSQSLREALKANPSASSKDRRTLNEAVIQLEAQQQKLEGADLQALAESTVVAAKTQLQLGELGEEFAVYKAEWQQRLAEIESEIERFMQQLKEG